MSAKSVIKIHHISDLHVPSEKAKDSKHYVVYLDRLRDWREERPDFIAITGDLPLIGGADIDAVKDRFLKVLWSANKRLLNISPWKRPEETKEILKSRTVFTPGNHDLDWEELDKRGRKKALGAFKNLVKGVPSPYWNGDCSLEYLEAFGSNGVAAFAVPSIHVIFCCFDSTFRGGTIDETLKEYFNTIDAHCKELRKKYDSYLEKVKKVKGKRKSGLAETLEKEWKDIGDKITNICRTDPGFVSPAALHRTASILKKLENKIYPSKEITPLRIALVHHNPCSWSPEDEKKRYALFPNACQFLSVLRKCGFHLLLCGHSHQRCLYFHYDYLENANCRGLYVLGAPSLSSPGESEHGFNEIEVERVGPEIVRLKIRPFEKSLAGFEQIRDHSVEFDVDLGASTFTDSIERMRREYNQNKGKAVKSTSNGSWQKNVISDLDELQNQAEDFKEAHGKMVRAICSGGRLHLPRGKRWFSGLEKIGKVLEESLKDAVKNREDGTSVEVFAVHAFGGEMWRRKELYNYLDKQIKYARKDIAKIQRIFLYEPGKPSMAIWQGKLRYLICALDEQKHAKMEVFGMPMETYRNLMSQLLGDGRHMPFCREIASGGVMSCDWAFFRWRQKGEERWRLAVIDAALMEPEIVAPSNENVRIFGSVRCDIAMYMIDFNMLDHNLEQLNQVFDDTWRQLEQKASAHGSLDKSKLLKEFKNTFRTFPRFSKQFGDEMEGRHKWVTGVTEIEKSKKIKAVDICYSAIDYYKCKATAGVHTRNIEKVVEKSDVWADYLLRVWTLAHKTAAEEKVATCQRIFVLSDVLLQDWDILFKRFEVLKEQFCEDHDGNTENPPATLGLLLDTDILLKQDTKKKPRKLEVYGTGNYLITYRKIDAHPHFLWYFPGQNWSPQNIRGTNLYFWQKQASRAKIEEFEVCYNTAWQLVVDLDSEAKKKGLFGGRLARQPEELLGCLAHLRQISIDRKELKNEYIKKYWSEMNNL